MVEIEVAGGDGRFFGAATFYGVPDFFQQLASDLEGFPASQGDVRRVSLTDDRESGSQLEIRSDSVGKISVSVALAECQDSKSEFCSFVKFRFYTEPALMDRFVQSLRIRMPAAEHRWHLGAIA